MKREEEIKAKGKRQRAKGREQRAESREQSVIGHWSMPARLHQSGGVIGKQEPVCALFFAVDFSQRIKKYNVRNGLQPHSMWLKPDFNCNYSTRQLPACRTGRKQTAINSAAHGAVSNETSTVCLPAPLNPLKGAPRFQKESGAGFVCGISPLGVRGSAGFEMITKRFSTVFQLIKPSATETCCSTEGCISGSRAVRACLTIRLFNN